MYDNINDGFVRAINRFRISNTELFTSTLPSEVGYYWCMNGMSKRIVEVKYSTINKFFYIGTECPYGDICKLNYKWGSRLIPPTV